MCPWGAVFMDASSRSGLTFPDASDTCLMDRMKEETLERTQEFFSKNREVHRCSSVFLDQVRSCGKTIGWQVLCRSGYREQFGKIEYRVWEIMQRCPELLNAAEQLAPAYENNNKKDHKKYCSKLRELKSTLDEDKETVLQLKGQFKDLLSHFGFPNELEPQEPPQQPRRVQERAPQQTPRRIPVVLRREQQDDLEHLLPQELSFVQRHSFIIGFVISLVVLLALIIFSLSFFLSLTRKKDNDF